MRELSLHILDIAENGIRAGATRVNILLEEDTKEDRLTLTVRDNGAGMDEQTRCRVLDPFFTTKKVRRVGLGLPMLAEAARRTGGGLVLASRPGEGTAVSASFGLRHIDRQPLGDLAGSLVALIAGNPGVDVLYEHRRDGRAYRLDTQEIKEALGNVSITHVPVLQFLRKNVEAGRREIGSTA